MLVLRQIWALAQKDLIIFRRRWFSTTLRALILPIVYTAVLCYIRYWTATAGYFGVGDPQPIMSLANALSSTGDVRPKFVVVSPFEHTLPQFGTDGKQVVAGLQHIVTQSGKEFHLTNDSADVASLCKPSSRGVTDCFAAVVFTDSPQHTPHGGNVWSYTIATDAALGSSVDVRAANNDAQVYILPLQNEILKQIDAVSEGDARLPDNMVQYPFTPSSEQAKETLDRQRYQILVIRVIAFGFFIGISSSIYHCIGHIVRQREEGILQLIDAMMPNQSSWLCIIIRMVASHLSFDMLYLPSWIAVGGFFKVAFPSTDIGLLIGLTILTGLALTSYSILTSSLFRRAQLSAISGMIAAVCFAIVAIFAIGPGDELHPEATQTGALATAILFPPSAFVYFLMQVSAFEVLGFPFDLDSTSHYLLWHITPKTLLGFLIFQITAFPIFAVIIEKLLHSTASSARKVSKTGELAVRLNKFTKIYNRRRKSKLVAVNELSMDLHAGSVTVLLGANGSGKSTTLTAIAGLQKFSQGTIEINGTIGICPQENVFWSDLTVEEHIYLFDLLKATTSQPRSERRAEVTRLIDGCDLAVKRHAYAKTLSGGQKRKLQLAMMFAGGSNICCIDEATSGIDPLARRKIWDILLAERGRRTLLMTTHFLDEAEVLSDHVAILSKGNLKAEGSVASLKAQLGGGFRVLLGEQTAGISMPDMLGVIRRSDDTRAIFEVPDSTKLAGLVRQLDRASLPYTIHGPTVENIFLKLSEEMKQDTETAREFGVTDSSDNFSLQTGRGARPIQQIGIMFHKRLTILKHNYMPYIAVLFVPLTLAGLVTRFFINYEYQDGIPCSNAPSTVDLRGDPFDLANIYYDGFTYGPPSDNMKNQVKDFFPEAYRYTFVNESYFDQQFAGVATAATPEGIRDNVERYGQGWVLGGFWNDPKAPQLAWPAQGLEPIVQLQSMAGGILMNQSIDARYVTFPEGFIPENFITLLVAIFTILGFAIYPGFLALYPTRERLRKVRAMQYSNGILGSSLWIAYALFDLMFILLVSILTPVIWSTQWQGWYGLEYMAIVFFLYGLAATALAYVVSLFAGSQLAAFSATAIIQLVIGMLYFAGYAISGARASSALVYTWFNYIHYTVALIAPIASLMRALFMTLNNYGLACHDRDLSTTPWEMGIYGAPILYLVLQFVFLVMFLMFWESGRSLEIFGIRLRRSPRGDAEKSSRSSGEGGISEGLQIDNLSKSFGSLKAVDDVSFGISPSEKFALLGPNGAGKSTIVSLVQGDLAPSGRSSAIYIGRDSLQHAPVAAKNHLGVCPQFDATDSMTLREHLMFYARARGVPDPKHNVDQLIKRLGLEPHQKKLAKKLSGGTHRKLSLAIALIANPLVLLLDEPSSGMDPAAKRALWSTLRETAHGRVLLLTTHSMEEAAAICDRAGILASQLLVQGSIDELCRTYGPEACVLLVHQSAPYANQQEMDAVKMWVRQTFPSAEMEERNFGGQIRFNIPRGTGYEMGAMFQEIESAKERLGLIDYSIGPATLDQVFLDVVMAHGVKEENTEEEVRRWRLPWSKRG